MHSLASLGSKSKHGPFFEIAGILCNMTGLFVYTVFYREYVVFGTNNVRVKLQGFQSKALTSLSK